MGIYREVEVDISEILCNLSSKEKVEALEILGAHNGNIPTSADELIEYLKNAPGSQIEYLKLVFDDKVKSILKKIAGLE